MDRSHIKSPPYLVLEHEVWCECSKPKLMYGVKFSCEHCHGAIREIASKKLNVKRYEAPKK